MASEVNTLGRYLNDLSEKSRHTRDFTLNSLRRVIVEVIAALSVYRTYTNTWQASDRDVQYIEHAVSRAKRKNPALSGSIFDFLRDVLTLRFPKDLKDEDKSAWLDFVMRFQQITGPIMAKGVEDTAFYVYNRLVSLNDVGGTPDRFGTSLETFHGQNIERMKSWPHAMITTSTHDSKRSEDVRARINVLSEEPREWADRARSWARMNKKKKTVIDGVEIPVRPNNGATPISDREFYFADLPAKDSPFAEFYGRGSHGAHGYYQDKSFVTFNFTGANLLRKYGPQWKTQSAEIAHRRLRSWGLNTIANWSDPEIYLLRKTPYTATVGLRGKAPAIAGSTGYWGKFSDVFDPAFAQGLHKAMAAEAGKSAGDPWCLGYFVDNELSWGDELSLALATLALTVTAALGVSVKGRISSRS